MIITTASIVFGIDELPPKRTRNGAIMGALVQIEAPINPRQDRKAGAASSVLRDEQ
jgi:hypothetical protein